MFGPWSRFCLFGERLPLQRVLWGRRSEKCVRHADRWAQNHDDALRGQLGQIYILRVHSEAPTGQVVIIKANRKYPNIRSFDQNYFIAHLKLDKRKDSGILYWRRNHDFLKNNLILKKRHRPRTTIYSDSEHVLRGTSDCFCKIILQTKSVGALHLCPYSKNMPRMKVNRGLIVYLGGESKS